LNNELRIASSVASAMATKGLSIRDSLSRIADRISFFLSGCRQVVEKPIT